MLKVENIESMGWEGALRGMRNPLNSWSKADSAYSADIPHTDTNIALYGDKLNKYDYILGANDLTLATKLIKAGSEHRKFLRMIHVQMDITAPLYWWKEYETYKVATTSNSCSTMHKIAAKSFDLEDFSYEHMDRHALTVLKVVVGELNTSRDIYLNNPCKANWWQMIQLLPSSYNQRRTVDMSMETVLNIISQRHAHKLDEWVYLCEQMLAQIPYCNEFYAAYKGGYTDERKD